MIESVTLKSLRSELADCELKIEEMGKLIAELRQYEEQAERLSEAIAILSGQVKPKKESQTQRGQWQPLLKDLLAPAKAPLSRKEIYDQLGVADSKSKEYKSIMMAIYNAETSGKIIKIIDPKTGEEYFKWHNNCSTVPVLGAVGIKVEG